MLKFNDKINKKNYRLSTIFASGFGAASLSLWSIHNSVSGMIDAQSLTITSSIICGIAALAGAGCAQAYFATGGDHSEAIDKLRHCDSITGVLSRCGMEDALPNFFSAKNKKAYSERVFLISMDFDELREINDVYGTENGNQVIKIIADRLSALVGDSGPLARTNGSEFLLALKAGHDRELRAAIVAVIDTISKPVRIGAIAYPIYANAGAVEILNGNEQLEKIVRKANLARNNAKKSGRGFYTIYHSEMSQQARYRQWLETELIYAIERGEINIAYQPQVYSPTGKTIGYEALARWTHHEKGAISPDEFIAVAEGCGYIHTLGEWVLRQACMDAMQLPVHTIMSVNVSTYQLENVDFINTLKSILNETGLSASRLEIEVTESVLIKDHEHMKYVFQTLRDIGVAIAIDDFGTGYSNMTNLSELTFDKIKIDKSFIDRIGESKKLEQLVLTMVNLAHSFDAKVVAEGIEQKEQAIFLNAAGCAIMQGYLYGRPAPLNAVLDISKKIAA